MCSPIWMKFCRLVQNDMPTLVMWSKLRLKVEFQYGRSLFFEIRSKVVK